jgi:hypothetical protein
MVPLYATEPAVVRNPFDDPGGVCARHPRPCARWTRRHGVGDSRRIMDEQSGPECHYRSGAYVPWTNPTQFNDDAGISVVGQCRRCEHETTYVSRIVLKSSASSSRTQGAAPQIIIQCDCGAFHEGRVEADGRGCGAFWYYAEPG